MKKFIFYTAAIMLAFTINAFAGTPETKGPAENKLEIKQMANRYVHVGNGEYLPAQNVGSESCNASGDHPCIIESDEWEPDGFLHTSKSGDSQESTQTGKYQ